VNGATVSLLPRADHYVVSVISIGDACPDSAGTYKAVFYLTEPVDAGRVATELDLVTDP
jgi:hypothetical protein